MAIGIGGWYFFPQSVNTEEPENIEGFGAADNRLVNNDPSAEIAILATGSSTQPRSQGAQKIFKIADGPIASATFVQTLRPTTTLARYIKANNGHVQDVMLDSSGAVPKAVSNTTIPGVLRALWGESGNAAVVQYMDGAILKTARISFPQATTSTTAGVRTARLQFLQNNVADIAVSPGGSSLAYLLRTNTGLDGYITKMDGSSPKKIFSLPLFEILLSWPREDTLLAHTKSAAGIPGIAFSINAQNGNVVPLLYAAGLTVIADRTFSRIMYQTVGGSHTSYLRDIQKGSDTPLSFDPIPEKCSWSTTDTITLYCGVPLQFTPANYLDLWHQGKEASADSIVSFNALSGKSFILTSPGSGDGGVNSDIIEIKNSPDGKYLLFITKGDRSLWGVRISQ